MMPSDGPGNGHDGLIEVLRVGVRSGEARETDPLRFERRRAPRYATCGHARGILTGAEGTRMTGVWLVESSACGLAVRMAIEPSPGDRLEIYFANDPIPGRAGVVRRCETVETDDGLRYEVGIESTALRAA